MMRSLIICLFNNYYRCDQIKEDEMVRAYSMHGNVEKCIQDFNNKI